MGELAPSRRDHRSVLALLIASAILAVAATLTIATPAAATYHQNYGLWHDLYYLDGVWVGTDLNQVNYYTWSDGTESVSDIYGGLYRSYNDQGLCCMRWYNPWLTNRDGSVPLSLSWTRYDCGYGCQWVQKVWSGWVTVRANYDYGLDQHNTALAAARWAPYLVLYWP